LVATARAERRATEPAGRAAPAEAALTAGATRRLADLVQDVRYGLRTLGRSPGYAAAAILTLALGVGANSAIFSIVNATLLQELPVREPDRLAFVTSENAGVVFSYPEYADLREHQRPFEGLAAWGGITASLTSAGRADLVDGAIVSGNYFEVLGVSPALGRLLSPQDDRAPGAHPIVVISHGLWQRRFGGQSDVAGREILLGGHPFEMVGVTPAGFTGAQLGVALDLWVPLAMQAVARPPRAGYSGEMEPDLLGRRGARWLFLVGRLAPGRTRAEARAALGPLGAPLAEAAGRDEPYRFAVAPAAGGDPDVRAQLVPVATLLFAVVGAVLLIACANVANLALSRAAARQRETAIRVAIGAGGGRLLRQLLTESLLLSLAGGGLGLALAFWTVRALRAAPPPGGLPLAIAPELDLRVLLFTLAVAVLAGLLFGLAPALRAARVDLVPALREGAAGDSGRGLGLRGGLAVGQVALSLLLLATAGLFLRSLNRAQSIPTGIDEERLLSAPLRIELLRYTRDQGVRFYTRVVEEVEALPGVEAAALARVAVLSGGGRTSSLHLEGRGGADGAFRSEGGGPTASRRDSVNANVVDPGYFRTLGVRLRAGRLFDAADGAAAPPVAIVNETFVRMHFPNGGQHEALRTRISLGGPEGPWADVVGVVSDTRYRALVEPPAPIVYQSLAQQHESGVFLYVRGAGDPARLAPAVRRAIETLEPNLPQSGVRPVSDAIGRSLYPARMGALMLGGFGVLALALAAVGVYGVMAFAVSRRTREIGVRMALGAERGAVLRLVMRDGLRLIAAGTALGLAAAAASTRALEGLLYGVSGMDAPTLGAVTAALAAVAALACLVPARRAAGVDPLAALRSE
jgi:predicted permease